ncbi:MAG: glycoside hydrolase family 3 N-terminal domain-containing protein [bacterium]|nr:glycoside hydrolase family 3 N-terminal domain-containing protein [bacterium]
MNEPVPLIVGFKGTQLDEETKAHLLEINPMGVIFFKRNLAEPEQIRSLVAEVKRLLGPILVAVDHEGGMVNRFSPELATPPAPFALNFTGPQEQKQATQMLAALPAHFGFNLNLAPVLDLFDADSEAINIRAFSRDPEEVGRWGSMIVEAHEEVGLGSCGKHFPGHGRVRTDTHNRAGVADFTAEELQAKDLLPYRRMALPAVMTSHLIYPAFDAQNPASLSKAVITDLLKGQMGFKGLVLSDCVEMEAISASFGPEEIVAKGKEAGLDLWISSYSIKADLGFQKALADAMRAQGLAGKNPKVRDFLMDYPGRKPQLFRLDEAVALRRETIQRGGVKPAPPWELAVVSSKAFNGINRDEPEEGFRYWMKMGLGELVPNSLELSLDDLDSAEEYFKEVRQSGRSLLLATQAARRHPNWEKFMQLIENMKSVLHLDLGEGADIIGSIEGKWNCFGSDRLTVQAICRELKVGLATGVPDSAKP